MSDARNLDEKPPLDPVNNLHSAGEAWVGKGRSGEQIILSLKLNKGSGNKPTNTYDIDLNLDPVEGYDNAQFIMKELHALIKKIT